MAAQLRLSLANATIVVLLLLGLPRRVLSSPDGFDGEVHPPFNVSEGAVQDKDTLCPLVELPVAYNGQVQAYRIWPSDGVIQAAIRNVILTPCLQNSAGLDRDTRASYSFILTAIAADGTGSDSINITLRLLDINDNSPSFLDSTTSASYTIPENAAVHDSVGPGPIVAEDPDEGVNGTVRYQLEGCSDVFQIHNTSGLITLKASSVDREMRDTYSCMVTASDMAVHNPRSASWEFDIVISDVNDNAPHCFDGQDKHSLNITENASSFVPFVCEDADKGSNGTVNTTVILANTSLSNNISVMYHPLPISRYVLMIKGLDREALGPGEDRYIIQLNVSDEGSPPQITPLFVTISVNDVNDTPPQFEGPSSLYVSEDHVADQPVGRVHFTDPDLHSTLHYSLRQAMRGKEDIRLSANISIANNGNIFVSNSSFLDFESPLPPLIILTVDVTDGLHTTTANVTLNITDVNDNIPEFESSAYSFDVVENVATGTPVGNVTAQDADSGNYGAIRYTIRTMGAPFMISETSGVIITSGPIDRERIDSYSIEVMAEDRGTLEKDVAQVNIIVRDEDDNCPIFLDKDYVIEWYQDDMKVPFGVKATDADSDAFNTVRYSLNRVTEFEIDENSGIVSLRDSEQKNENTTLKVTAEANVEGGSTNCVPVEATLVIIFYGVQRPTASPTESPKTLTVITIVCSVLGVVVLCVVVAVFAILVSCVCIRRHSKTYNVNNFSPTESPLEKVTVARTKSILKSYSSDGTDGKQKNSVRFVEVIEKGDIHVFEPESPVSSPEIDNGAPSHHQPHGSHSSQLSIDSSSCEDELPPFMPVDYRDNEEPMNTTGLMNDCYNMEFGPSHFRPPTPPLSHSSLEERIPLQDMSFTTRQSESNVLPHNGHYVHHPEQQLSLSSHYHPSTQRSNVGFLQQRSGTSFLSGSGTSLASDDRDSYCASLDNFSTYTEQGTDIMSQVPGPMENLFSNLQSARLQRYVDAGHAKASLFKDNKQFEL